MEEVVKSTCRMCHGVCGVLVHKKNGKVVKIEGDPDCPLSEGYTCAKGRASIELLYHPDRLKYPLKRAGERGENKWKRISWKEALDEIAYKFMEIKREYGAQSIGIVHGTGRPFFDLLFRFANCLGTPNISGVGHVCYLPRVMASRMTCSMPVGLPSLPVCDFYGFGGVYPKCVLVWGANIAESGAADGMCGVKLVKTIRRGAKLIVIDPRKIHENADIWVPIRPGTDAFLALAMLNVIIKQKLFDKEFVEKWTVGFKELKERVKDYTPESVEKITWIPSETIQKVAETYAQTKPACILWGVSIDQNANNFQTARALLCLMGITGNIDVPGGNVFWVPPEGVVGGRFVNPGIELRERLPPEIRDKSLKSEKYKLSGIPSHVLWNAILEDKPYPVKALFIMSINPLVTHPNSEIVFKALKKVDFTVVVDLFMTPTAQQADIVLPAASWLEIDDVADLHFIWCYALRQKVDQIGECRDDREILIELAKRLGFAEDFPWRDVKDYLNWRLRGAGIDFEKFKQIGLLKGKMEYRKYERLGFNTPSKKFEFYCSQLKSLGFDPLPSAKIPPQYLDAQLTNEYPLILITGLRVEYFFGSEGRQLTSLRKHHPDPIVEINPTTAKDLGINDGDWVWIETKSGRIKQKARLTHRIHPKVVGAQFGWWFPEKPPPEYGWRESNVNILTGGGPYDPQTGGEYLRGIPCKIYVKK